ncbi:MAG TPA: SRPBCC domain-containing protein [Phycisphaerae bacterium]|nr:SRPBCC domain-containing protein [Phycisphaerae bacterium]
MAKAIKAGGIGSDAVKAATGKGWDEWFRIIDRAGGRKMDHKQIVAVVSKQKGARPWWQQMITVGYEQARGLRKVGETAKGYQISRSKTVDAPLPALFKAWKDPKARGRWLSLGGAGVPARQKSDSDLVIRRATANKSLRITWPDETNIEVNFYKTPSGKTQVTVQHNKLADAKTAAKMKAYWGKQLEQLAALSPTGK